MKFKKYSDFSGLNEGTYNSDKEIAIYNGEDGLTYIEKRGKGYYGYNNEFDFEAKNKKELEQKLKSWNYYLISGSLDESEAIKNVAGKYAVNESLLFGLAVGLAHLAAAAGMYKIMKQAYDPSAVDRSWERHQRRLAANRKKLEDIYGQDIQGLYDQFIKELSELDQKTGANLVKQWRNLKSRDLARIAKEKNLFPGFSSGEIDNLVGLFDEFKNIY